MSLALVSSWLAAVALVCTERPGRQEPVARPGQTATIDAIVGAFRQKHRPKGLVIGYLHGRRRRVLAWGHGGSGVRRPLDGDTIFEIGSVSKTLTGVLLATMVRADEVALGDTVASFLPRFVGIPSRGQREITLLDLVTHASGLPRLPTNLAPDEPGDPYADYGVVRLYRFLQGHRLRVRPGDSFRYSNLGVGLLGHALERKSDASLESLVRRRVCAPLGLVDTAIRLTDEQRGRLARPHLRLGARGKRWHFDALAAAGAFHSTANDLLRFAAANFENANTPLSKSLALTHVPRRATSWKGVRCGLGWMINDWGAADNPMLWHNGRTGGFGCILLVLKRQKLAVVVLCNQSLDVDKLGGDIARTLQIRRRVKPERRR